VEVTMPVKANVIFAKLPKSIIASMQALFPFYIWDEATNEVRLMCSFDTSKEEVEAFALHLKKLFEAQ
jgi:threonine aldolase